MKVITLILAGLTLILIECFFLKKNNKRIYESLVVSPTRLFSSDENIKQNICNVVNSNPINGKKSFIDINTYLNIKSPNINKRPGIELIGYKIRIELPRFKYSPQSKKNLISEEHDYCQIEEDDENSNPMIDQNLNRELFPEELETINETQNKNDLETDKDYSSSCDKNNCWYNATIVNYVYKKPFSLHKISWYNNNYELESKWINLNQYNIQVPIEPYYKAFSQMIGDNENIYTNNSKYLFKTELRDEQAMKNLIKDKPVKDSLMNLFNFEKCSKSCLTPPKIPYFGEISCSKNEDCHKYGSYFCSDGKCQTGYLNFDLQP